MRRFEPGEAAYLAGLPEGHPERVEAEAHARSLPAERRAFAEGERLQQLLEDHPPVEPVGADILARVEATVLDAMDAEAAPTSPRRFGWTAWLPVASAVALWLVLALRHLAAGRGAAAVAGSLGLASLGLGALAIALAFVEPRIARGTLAAVLGASAAGAALLADWGAAPAFVGVKCAVVEVGGSLVPVVLLGALYLRHGGRPGALRFAVVAAAGALVVQSALELGCQAPGGMAHALVMHACAVAVAAALGAGLSVLVPARRATV